MKNQVLTLLFNKAINQLNSNCLNKFLLVVTVLAFSSFIHIILQQKKVYGKTKLLVRCKGLQYIWEWSIARVYPYTKKMICLAINWFLFEL